MTDPAASAPPAASPLAAVRDLLSLLAGAALTRGELAAVELSEARHRALRWLGLALIAAALLLAALLTASLLVAAVFWDSYRWQALVAVVALYGVAGGWVAGRLRAEVRAAPPLFDATLGALRQDCASVRGAPPAG